MDNLRTVTVLEHEVIPVIEDGNVQGMVEDTDLWLSETEAEALLRLNDLRRGFCQRLPGGIKLAQHCGIVSLPTCVVEVLPKVGMADARSLGELERSRGALLTMLHSARKVTITKIGPVPQQAVQAPLLDIFIETFLHCALDQARRGLLSRYMAHVEDLPVIKGRLQAHGHFRRNLVRPHLLYCEYDEFTADNAYNRAVRATLEACRTWVRRSSIQRLWFETYARFSCVSAVKVLPVDVARLPRDRTTRHYHSLLTWCEWLLAATSPALNVGASPAPGLLFDMNKLFEAHTARLEETDTGPNRIVHTQGPTLRLATHAQTDLLLLKPDITVWHVDKDGAAAGIDRIVDAKWKRVVPHRSDFGVDEADVYQMLAYAIRYGCTTLELAYPMPVDNKSFGRPPVLSIQAASLSRTVTIKVKLVPLWSANAPEPDNETECAEAETA